MLLRDVSDAWNLTLVPGAVANLLLQLLGQAQILGHVHEGTPRRRPGAGTAHRTDRRLYDTVSSRAGQSGTRPFPRHSCVSAISIARSRPRALLSVSSRSLAGSLSATMPAPACR